MGFVCYFIGSCDTHKKNTLNPLHLLFLGLVWYGLGFLCGANSRRWRRVHSRTSHGPKHSRGTNKSSNPNWNENTHTFVKCITPLVKNTLHSEVIGKWFYRFFINSHYLVLVKSMFEWGRIHKKNRKLGQLSWVVGTPSSPSPPHVELFLLLFSFFWKWILVNVTIGPINY